MRRCSEKGSKVPAANEQSRLSAEILPPAQRLALAYASPRSRPSTLAVLALDARLAQILRGRREPLGAQLRLAWWRETLERPLAEWPLGEPLLASLREWGDPAALAALPAGWEALLADELSPQAIAEFVDARGQAFAALARELGVEAPERAAAAGRIWALADLAANVSAGAERQLAVDYGRTLGPPPRLSASLRPVAVLAALGAAALARGGGELLAGPRSAFLALRTGLTGR
jgi:phytoene synthase